MAPLLHRAAIMTLLLCNLLNEVRSLFGILNYVHDVVVKKATFAIAYPGEFLVTVLLSVTDPGIWNGEATCPSPPLPH